MYRRKILPGLASELALPSRSWRFAKKLRRSQTNMVPLSARESSALCRTVFSFALFLACVGAAPRCRAQRNSGGAAVTITAVLSQSMSMSVTPALDFNSFDDLLSDSANDGRSALTISTTWVRGPANVSVGVFAPANPLLGARGQALVPVASVDAAAPSALVGNSFLSLKKPVNFDLPGIRINTSDLEIPAGSEAGMLTVRGQVL
jgi:hypothetical protein